MAKYQANVAVTSTDGSELIELRNPSGSGKTLEVLKIGVVSDVGFSIYSFTRYDDLATHEALPAPSQIDVYKWNPGHASPAGEVWFGDAGSMVFQGNIDFAHSEQMDSGDGGDDAEIIFGKYLDGEQIAMVPGTSARFEIPTDASASYIVKIIWQEVAV